MQVHQLHDRANTEKYISLLTDSVNQNLIKFSTT